MILEDIDWRSPLAAFAPLANEPWAALLHAGETAGEPGWSVVAAFPARRIEARGGTVFLDGQPSGGDPFVALDDVVRARRMRAGLAQSECVAPFSSGLVGFVGYEMAGQVEPSGAGPASPFSLPDMAFGAYDAVALFDRRRRRALIASVDAAPATRLREALGEGAEADAGPVAFDAPSSNFSCEEYERAVAGVIEDIREGRLFQANIAQQLAATGHAAPFDIFRRMSAGDAPFGAFLLYNDGAIVSNSPERFFRIEPAADGARILAEPIKGTRPRGQNDAEDAALAAELLADPKDRAENIMIADLMRNDLSRICRDGTIHEEAICALVTHANVHHLVSRIAGVLHEGMTPAAALAALFPAGSITGAPKVEAMKVIAELEGVGRGPYCGAIGYIDDRGGADFSVAIRTMVVEKDGGGARAVFPVGGGVTLRSDPQAEYMETMVKARGALKALGLGPQSA